MRKTPPRKSPQLSPIQNTLDHNHKKKSPNFMINLFSCFTGQSHDDDNTTNNNPVSFSTDVSGESLYRSASKDSKPTFSTSSYGSYISESGPIGTSNFTFNEIYKATDKFSPANVIGEGGAGTVYKGKLKNGSIVAVKRAKMNVYNKRLTVEFKNEILTLSQIEHRSLVRLFGYLEHNDERIIVVEYVGNGTLRQHLDGKRGNGLEIADRLDIAIDVAHAITYLHMYTERPIIHRDIKASNILITEKLGAKVADFGFARLAEEDSDATHISTGVKGTAGYLDPEYIKSYQLTEKSDVYSFGVLLVEIVTGRPPLQPKRPIKEHSTVKWAMYKLRDGDAVIAMDPIIKRTPASVIAVEKMLKLARKCLAPTRQPRPSMKYCAEVLWGIRKDYNDKAFPAPNAAAASHYSENYLETNRKRNPHTTLGLDTDSDNHQFRSA